MTTLRVACVGTGFIAGRHLQALSTMPEVDLVAVADTVPARAEQVAREYDVRAYTSGEDLLAREELDAVWLCVPPFAHGPLEQLATARGLPFFVEKPLSQDLATAVAVDAEVRAQGVPTAVGYHWRHLPMVQDVAAALKAAPAQLAMGYWMDATPAAPWWSQRDRSGGQLLEQTTHLFDLLRLLLGEVESVTAVERTLPRPSFPDADVPTVSAATLAFPTGAIATVASTCLLGSRHRVGVTLVSDGAVIELREDSLRSHRLEMTGREPVSSEEDPIATEDRDFVDVLSGRRPRALVPYEEALRTHALVCAVDQAARDGGTVHRREDGTYG